MKRGILLAGILAAMGAGADLGGRRAPIRGERIPAPAKVLRRMQRGGKKKPRCYGSRASGYRG